MLLLAGAVTLFGEGDPMMASDDGILNSWESLERRTVGLLGEGNADDSWGMTCYELREREGERERKRERGREKERERERRAAALR